MITVLVIAARNNPNSYKDSWEFTLLVQRLAEIPIGLWLLLMAGPFLFLLGTVAVSIGFVIRSTPPEQISSEVMAFVPHILLGVLFCLLMALFAAFPNSSKAAWMPLVNDKALIDVMVGMLCGAILAFAYIYWLAPLLEYFQSTFGDYVSPGSVLKTVSSSITLFFLANVILAPLVEETLYRGVALPMLETELGVTWAVLLSCLFFGLLHWMGGVWYMILTGVVAGGLFTGLYYVRGGVMAPFAAHLTLNLIEYIYAFRVQTIAQQ